VAYKLPIKYQAEDTRDEVGRGSREPEILKI
jgi:hypothetical protein